MKRPRPTQQEMIAALDRVGVLEDAHACCEENHAILTEALCRSRITRITRARAALCALLLDHPRVELSSIEVGRMMGIHHASVLYAAKAHAVRGRNAIGTPPPVELGDLGPLEDA